MQGDIIDFSREFTLRAASKAEVLLKSRTSYELGKDVVLGHCVEWNAVLEHSPPQDAFQLTGRLSEARLQCRP